ncbi:MAG: hypothetical protein U0414_16505 [Polyangiaceae bacterium]
MNFLLHRHFALRERPRGGDDAAYLLGAMLPDLLRLVAPRRSRIRGAAVDALRLHAASDVRALGDGVAHHHDIDRWFHGCAVFEAGERALKDRFLETGTRRLLLFAHPGFEMCLDGAWLRREAEDVGFDFAGARDLVLEAARVTDLELDPTRVARVLAALDDGMLYDDYRSSRGIARRIAGMRLAFGFGASTADDLERWSAALEPSVESAHAALCELEASRTSSLDAARP